MSTSRAPKCPAAALWSLSVVALTLAVAMVRLGHRALDLPFAQLDLARAAAAVVLGASFAYGEGYLALHRRFVPALVDRAWDLPRPAGPGWLLAPLVVCGLAGGTRARRLAHWSGVAAIVGAVVLVARLPTPWRGMVDGAVALAMAIGLLSLLWRAGARWSASERAAPADLGASRQEALR